MDKVTFNKEDLVDHHCVSAIVFNNDRSKIIQLYHNKLQLWTVPVGKCDKSVGPERTLIRELKEEIDIWPVEFEEVHVFEKTYMRGNIPVKVTNHIFVVNSYIGEVFNKEPDKHREMIWVTIDMLKDMAIKFSVTDSNKETIKLFEGGLK